MPDMARDVLGITGRTRLVAVLGDPVEQVRAPALLNGLLARLGIGTVVIPVHVRPGDLGAVVPGLQKTANLDGLLITVPHKVDVLRYADVRGRAAVLAESANAMRRQEDGSWHADNFDGAGFLAGLIAAGYAPLRKHVALVGTGGAGVAIAAVLLGAGAAGLTLHDVDDFRVNKVAEHLGSHWPGRVAVAASPDFGAADIVVNATPLGMRPDDPLPFDPATLRPDALVADIVMRPRETRLLRAAAELGHPVHFGEPMLKHQLDLYRNYFGWLSDAPAQGRCLRAARRCTRTA